MNIPEKITQVVQPTWNSCTSTCLAMITGRDVWEVIEDFHEDYMAGIQTEKEWLRKQGYIVEEDVYIEPDSGIYMLQVPSINLKTLWHSIVLDSRFTYNEWHKVFDPNNGKEGKCYYDGLACLYYDEDDVEDMPALIEQEGPAYKVRSWKVEYRVV